MITTNINHRPVCLSTCAKCSMWLSGSSSEKVNFSYCSFYSTDAKAPAPKGPSNNKPMLLDHASVTAACARWLSRNR